MCFNAICVSTSSSDLYPSCWSTLHCLCAYIKTKRITHYLLLPIDCSDLIYSLFFFFFFSPVFFFNYFPPLPFFFSSFFSIFLFFCISFVRFLHSYIYIVCSYFSKPFMVTIHDHVFTLGQNPRPTN